MNTAQTAALDLSLPIIGMSCASCATRVEKRLRALPGVLEAEVNLASEHAHVRAEASVTPATLIEAVRTAGYQVAQRELRLRISGMSCASCVGRVERALRRLPEVLDVQVNLADESARLQVLGGVPDSALLGVLDQAGYGAQLDEADGGPTTAARLSWQQGGGPVLIAALLSLPLVLPMLGLLWGQH
jgi:Cu+-exporting ATPase